MLETIKKNIIPVCVGVLLTFMGQYLYDYFQEAEKAKEQLTLMTIQKNLESAITETLEKQLGGLKGDLKSIVTAEVQKHVTQRHTSETEVQ